MKLYIEKQTECNGKVWHYVMLGKRCLEAFIDEAQANEKFEEVKAGLKNKIIKMEVTRSEEIE